MVHVIYIGQDITVERKFSSMLPDPNTFTLVLTTATFHAVIEKFQDDINSSFLLLLDTRFAALNFYPVSTYRSFLPTKRTRILALVDSSTARESILQQGVDDYLLLPLLDAEMRTRIGLQQANNQSTSAKSQPLQHYINTERLVTIGRLTSIFTHEIGNPIQVIQGALALALENPGDTLEVSDYIRLSYAETEKVVSLINMMREIYRPQSDYRNNTVSLQEVFKVVLRHAKPEFEKHDIQLALDLDVQVPLVQGSNNQLILAFLSILLDLIAILVQYESEALAISVTSQDKTVCCQLLTHLDFSTQNIDEIIDPDRTVSGNARKAFLVSGEILAANNGTLSFHSTNAGLVLRISLQASQAEA